MKAKQELKNKMFFNSCYPKMQIDIRVELSLPGLPVANSKHPARRQ